MITVNSSEGGKRGRWDSTLFVRIEIPTGVVALSEQHQENTVHMKRTDLGGESDGNAFACRLFYILLQPQNNTRTLYKDT
ncbi:hypothetical protein L2E82_11032 [Cichorium intybus]|uniref:Uncharacterized protein n=1 Tax=Cichorium intybus TaxID=13427 RepID=A0ACB9GCX5_CICIN|nr:hypothetical protein L2E82_11032 [Cichorium intybus]